MPEHNKRFPNLAKLSVAILEHYLKPILGDTAIKELRSPQVEEEIRKSVAGALLHAEKRFVVEYPDNDISSVVLQLPLGTLDSVGEAVQAFYKRQTDTTLLSTIQEQLAKDAPSLSAEVVRDAAETYIKILKQELAASVPTARSQLLALTTIDIGENAERIVERLDQLIQLLTPDFARPRILGNIPPRPSLVVGREKELQKLKARLAIPTASADGEPQTAVTIVRGWPGVGKTTLINLLAHEPEIATAFTDGVLWTALGENPNPLSELGAWGRALGVADIGKAQTVEEAVTRMTAILRDKQMLLIVDDVYESGHAVAFRVAGQQSKTIFTTRFGDVANALAATPDEIHRLPVLTNDKALELLTKLTPDTVKQHPAESKELVVDLEGLPLAIQVAGRLLQAEAALGWGVTELLRELREGTDLLKAKAPADRTDIAKQTTPTVAALLRKSTDRLSEEMRERFAFLGAFAPKPATFDLGAMAAVWEVDDPKPTVRALVARGLLERVGVRFQMHSLLVMHAREMLE